jgi:hypothetical protein
MKTTNQECAGKKSLGGRDFFQRLPTPTHKIFFLVGALFINYFIRKINDFINV